MKSNKSVSGPGPRDPPPRPGGGGDMMAGDTGRGKGQCLKVGCDRDAGPFKTFLGLRGSPVQRVLTVRDDAPTSPQH